MGAEGLMGIGCGEGGAGDLIVLGFTVLALLLCFGAT